MISFAPLSSASGLPVLEWEAGKQEVISVRGITHDIWDLYLVGNGISEKFASTARGSGGSVMYEINLPKNHTLGSFIVEARSANALTRQLAGINIVKMKDFNILQIPKKLMYICLTFMFIGIGLSTMRASHYARIEYLRPTRKRPQNIYLKRFFDFRQLLLEDLQPSLLKFQLTKEGELFHNISPWIWALAPFILFSLGAYTGTHSVNATSTMMISVLMYTIVAALGVFDPFSGIAASIGFFIAIALSGDVTNIHTLLSAITFVAGWFVPGIMASIFAESIRRDALPRVPARLLNIIPMALAGLIGAFVFYACELLTNSFSNQFAPVLDPGFLAPAILGVTISLRAFIDQFLIRDLHMRGENYQIRSITLPRVIAPQSVALASIYIFGATYSWTGNVQFSFITSLITFISFGLLLFRFESSIFNGFKRFKRHVLLESSLILLTTTSIFFYLGTLPLTIVSKGELYLLTTGVLFLIHAIYSALHDASTRITRDQQVTHTSREVSSGLSGASS